MERFASHLEFQGELVIGIVVLPVCVKCKRSFIRTDGVLGINYAKKDRTLFKTCVKSTISCVLLLLLCP